MHGLAPPILPSVHLRDGAQSACGRNRLARWFAAVAMSDWNNEANGAFRWRQFITGLLDTMLVHRVLCVSLALLVATFALLFSTAASSATVIVTAGPAQDAIADAGFSEPNADLDNSATAEGGHAFGGDPGGNALALAASQGAGVAITAISTGHGGNGLDGSNGGGVIATSQAFNSAGSANAQSWANSPYGFFAVGGFGDVGVLGGLGGSAQGSSSARTAGDGNSADAGSYIYGGDGGSARGGVTVAGAGGNALAQTTAIADGEALASAYGFAQGGDAGGIGSLGAAIESIGDGADGGVARSEVVASSNGQSDARAFGAAVGGNGGAGAGAGHRGADGASGTVTATASSSGGGVVYVDASLTAGNGGNGSEGGLSGNGGPANLLDAVSGATSGLLYLYQTATAGNGGNSELAGGVGGNATSMFTQGNALGGDVVGVSSAIAGTGGFGGPISPTPARGGNAQAGIWVVGESDVSALASAEGGRGSFGYSADAGNGGIASLGTVYGASTGGGAVHVQGLVRGGSGGQSTRGAGGRGTDAVLVDQVDGDTEGDLTLEQTSLAGAAGTGALPELGSSAGRAVSKLSRNKDAASLTVIAKASGGFRAGPMPGPESGGAGGEASALAYAENHGGSADARTDVHGGSGGGFFTGDAAIGASADGEASAVTSGDGHRASAHGFVIGGDGGYFLGGGIGLAGGAARSSSSALAMGNSAVDALDISFGGMGGVGLATGAADGGTASSDAFGGNQGDEQVVVVAEATGGRGGTSEQIAGNGGTGTARARGESLRGDVTVKAVLSGGAGGYPNSRGTGGRGGDATLLDAVSGVTSGTLSLEQGAEGGLGTNGYLGSGGDGGNAVSNLNFVAIRTGPMNGLSRAVGGAGGGVLPNVEPTVVAGDGGAASAFIALTGDGQVDATAIARGGQSGYIATGSPEFIGGVAGVGGNAFSSAFGRSGAESQLTVKATAIGGDGTVGPAGNLTRAPAGNAHSIATAAGGSQVDVSSTATGGTGTDPGHAGIALAQASASGIGIVQATAAASSRTGLVRFASTHVSSALAGTASVEAQTILSHGSLGADSDVSAAARILAAPDEDAASTVLAGHVNNSTIFDLEGETDILAIGTLRGTPNDSFLDSRHDYSASAVFTFDLASLAHSRQDLVLGLLDTTLSREFATLTLHVIVEGQLTELQFSDSGHAGRLFDDHALNIAQLAAIDLGSNGMLDLEIGMDVQSASFGGGFGFNFVLGNTSYPNAVPLPKPAWMLGLVLLGMASRRRRVGR